MEIYEFKEMLEEAMYRYDDEEEGQLVETQDLKNSMYLTNDEGMIVKYNDGSKFIITIQKVE